MIKKIGVLTSGGDAPGMNAAIRAVVRSATANNIEVYGIQQGFCGVYHDYIKKLTSTKVAGIVNLGGTFLSSSRFPEFKEIETRKKAVEVLKKHGIQALIVIGGDGSYMGAMSLSKMGFPCIGIPGTIDNDAPNTDFTIGFDTSLNTIVEAVDRLRDTSASHRRCSVVEVMGREAGDLALWAGIATGAEFTIVPEFDYDVEKIVAKIKDDRLSGKKHFIVIVAEGVKIVKQLVAKIEKETDIETRATVLGHIQRGGRPTAVDRVLASRMAKYAIDLLIAGESGRCVGIKENKLMHSDIIEAIEQNHTVDKELFNIANKYLNI